MSLAQIGEFSFDMATMNVTSDFYTVGSRFSAVTTTTPFMVRWPPFAGF
jgi:hypothetical protein